MRVIVLLPGLERTSQRKRSYLRSPSERSSHSASCSLSMGAERLYSKEVVGVGLYRVAVSMPSLQPYQEPGGDPLRCPSAVRTE
jgi:hypothetical protein